MAHAYLGVIAEESNDYSKANASFSMVLSLNDNDSATAWANDYYRRSQHCEADKERSSSCRVRPSLFRVGHGGLF